mgnify:FL=1
MRIALEGGGARSSFSAGVLRVLAREQVPVEAVVGSSSGAMNAAFFASGQIERMGELWRDGAFARRMVSYARFFNPFGGPGVDVDDLVENLLRAGGNLDAALAVGSGTRLFLTATNVRTMQAEVVQPDEQTIWDWLRASMAIPLGYNRIVRVGEEGYVDGGVASPIPFDLELPVATSGPGVAIITRRLDTPKPSPTWWQRALIRLLTPPGVREVTLVQHEHHNATVARLRVAAEAGDVLVVEPPEGMPISRLTRSGPVLAAGQEVGLRVGEELMRRLDAWHARYGSAQRQL